MKHQNKAQLMQSKLPFCSALVFCFVCVELKKKKVKLSNELVCRQLFVVVRLFFGSTFANGFRRLANLHFGAKTEFNAEKDAQNKKETRKKTREEKRKALGALRRTAPSACAPTKRLTGACQFHHRADFGVYFVFVFCVFVFEEEEEEKDEELKGERKVRKRKRFLLSSY